MNQDYLNRIRRMAGIEPSYDKKERDNLQEKESKKQMLEEAANHRAPNTLKDIARDHLNVRTLDKTGDDTKDYHDLPCWAINRALGAAYKAGMAAGTEKAAKKENVVEKADYVDKKAEKEEFRKQVKKGASFKKASKEARAKGDDNKEHLKEMGVGADMGLGAPCDPSQDEYLARARRSSAENEEFVSSYKKGDMVRYAGETYVVQVPDAKADYVGIIPTGMDDATEEEKDAAVDLVEISEIDPASEEDCAMAYSAEEVTMGEGSSEGYKNPKGTKLKADPDSGANAKKGDAYKDKPHKDNSMKAKSEDKGTAGLKQADEGVKDVLKTVGRTAGKAAIFGTKAALQSAAIGIGTDLAVKGAKAAYKKIKGKDKKADEKASKKAEDAHKEKGKKGGLKKIKEAEDATMWDQKYGEDVRDKGPDQLKAADHMAEEKIKVPAEHKTALREEIKKLKKEAENNAVRDPLGADFYANTAAVFENLLMHLEEGTRRSMNLAQIDLNRVMSPMINRLPSDVYMYIVRGGKPRALTELFKEVKVKNSGADLSKEEYTK